MNPMGLTWDEYFYRIAEAVAARSKDACQVGAVIVRELDHILLSTGYNGPARGVLDLPARLEERDEKLRWVCHAETNSIYNAARIGVAIEGATIYVTKFPCVACSSAIVQVGISRVFTFDSEPWKHDPFDDGNGTRSFAVLREAGITVHSPNLIPTLGRVHHLPGNGTGRPDSPTEEGAA